MKNEVRSIAQIDGKYFEYERIEQKILPLFTPQVTGSTIAPFTRLFFGSNKKLKGKRIVGISVNIPTALVASERPLNGGLIISNLDSQYFYLTLYDKNGNEAVKDLPLRTLITSFNGGKKRIFDVIPDLEKSYVQSTTTLGNGLLILFDFYTVDW